MGGCVKSVRSRVGVCVKSGKDQGVGVCVKSVRIRVGVCRLNPFLFHNSTYLGILELVCAPCQPELVALQLL